MLKNKVLVTGGSGFIGTNMVQYLLNLDYTVINFDNRAPLNQNHLNLWVKINICDKESLIQGIKNFNPNYIIHLAARTDLNEVVNIEGYNSNIQGVENVMNATLELPELKRIIIASSMLVCKVGYIPKSFNDYTPINLYGQSKVLTEKIVKNYNIDWVIVRPTSIWGPWFREPYFNFFKLVINGLYFNIPKKYSSTKTYGFVTNTCMQIYSIMLASNDKVSHKYFYLGDEIPINITEWANLIRFQLKKPNLITLPKYFLYLGSLFGDYLSKFCKFNKFPLNSFRYKNMTTNNIIESIQDTNKLLLENNLITLNDATSITLDWIKNKNI